MGSNLSTKTHLCTLALNVDRTSIMDTIDFIEAVDIWTIECYLSVGERRVYLQLLSDNIGMIRRLADKYNVHRQPFMKKEIKNG